MAPVKKTQPSNNKSRKPSSSSSSNSSRPKSSSRSKDVKRPPPKQVKTKPSTALTQRKRKTPNYTEAQLNLPAVNSIVPANAVAKTGKGAGKKRDKVYVDDTESMMTILAMVNAEKEGQIESKVLKSRQLEEIREARRKEAEKRAEGKKGKFEEVKKSLKRKGGAGKEAEKENGVDHGKDDRDGKKRRKSKSVSFA